MCGIFIKNIMGAIMNNKLSDNLAVLGEIAKMTGFDSLKAACELADSRDSNNVFFISPEVTRQIEISILPYLKDALNYLSSAKMTADKALVYANVIGGVIIDNDDCLGLDFPYPHDNQVVCFDAGEKRFLRLFIEKIKNDISINFTITIDGVYTDVGIIIYNEKQIVLKSPKNFRLDGHSDYVERSKKFLIILGLVKCIFERLLSKKYKYELRKATKVLKKRKIQPIRNDYKYISLDYMSLDEIKTIFKYENRNTQGAPKAPHDRSAHIRKLKSGKEVLVKSSKVRGGSKTVKFVNIK